MYILCRLCLYSNIIVNFFNKRNLHSYIGIETHYRINRSLNCLHVKIVATIIHFFRWFAFVYKMAKKSMDMYLFSYLFVQLHVFYYKNTFI